MTDNRPAFGGNDETVVLTRDGALAEVTLNRPAVHNALNLAMWQRLGTLFQTLADLPDLRVVIVRGAGNRAFSAGADIGEFRIARTGTQAVTYNEAVSAALASIRDLP